MQINNEKKYSEPFKPYGKRVYQIYKQINTLLFKLISGYQQRIVAMESEMIRIRAQLTVVPTFASWTVPGDHQLS